MSGTQLVPFASLYAQPVLYAQSACMGPQYCMPRQPVYVASLAFSLCVLVQVSRLPLRAGGHVVISGQFQP